MIYETKIRKIYRPLNISTSVEVSGVSLAQVVDQYENTTTPSRSSSQTTVLKPVVMALSGSDDNTWADGNVASKLVEIKWLCNGTDISVSGTDVYDAWHSAGSALFEIVHDSTANNGSLRIWKNLAAQEMCAMQMKAKFLDSRTGRYYEVLTDAVDLTAQALGDAEWDFSIVHDVNIKYCPVQDNLKLYDYLVAAGQLPEGKSRADYLDATAYEIRLPIFITYGHKKVTPTDKITFRAFDHLHDHAELTTSNNFFLREFDSEHILIDQRFLPDETYVIDVKMYVNDVFQSQEQITFSRYYPKIEAVPTNGSDLDLDAQTRWDKAFVTINGNHCEYPEAFLRLAWFARSSESEQWTPQGMGETCTINQQSLGISPTGRDELFIRLEYRIKSGLAPLSNEDGYLIENAVGNIIVADNIK